MMTIIMQNELLAYGQENKPCPNCGFPLRKIFIGGRGTVYCPHCQVYSHHPLIVAVTGPIASGKSTVSAYLEKKGYLKLDADEIVKELYEKPALQKQIAHLLGADVLTPNGLDHALMALPFSISQFPRKIPGFLPRRKVRIKNRKYGKISFLELIPGLFQKIEHQNKLQHWLPQNLIYGFGN